MQIYEHPLRYLHEKNNLVIFKYLLQKPFLVPFTTTQCQDFFQFLHGLTN